MSIRMLNNLTHSISRPVSVLIVDENEFHARSMADSMDGDLITVCGVATSGERALNMAPNLDPDVILMDTRMPGTDVVKTIKELKTRLPAVNILALTAFEEEHSVTSMLVAGACGYVLRDSDPDELSDAVLQAASGTGVVSPSMTLALIDQLTGSLERERERAREVEKAHEALLERAEHRQQLVARLGHELRTPITVIYGMAKALADGTVPEDQRDETIRTLVERAGSLQELVVELEGLLEIGLTEWTDVNEVARDVSIGLPRVEVQPWYRPAMASLNSASAHRIIKELVSNALKFSPDDEKVRVSITSENGHPVLRVIDRGPGISEDAMQQIFQPLEQAEDMERRSHEGLGLGLATARNAALAMGGDVIIERTGPEGSIFAWRISS